MARLNTALVEHAAVHLATEVQRDEAIAALAGLMNTELIRLYMPRLSVGVGTAVSPGKEILTAANALAKLAAKGAEMALVTWWIKS